MNGDAGGVPFNELVPFVRVGDQITIRVGSGDGVYVTITGEVEKQKASGWLYVGTVYGILGPAGEKPVHISILSAPAALRRWQRAQTDAAVEAESAAQHDCRHCLGPCEDSYTDDGVQRVTVTHEWDDAGHLVFSARKCSPSPTAFRAPVGQGHLQAAVAAIWGPAVAEVYRDHVSVLESVEDHHRRASGQADPGLVDRPNAAGRRIDQSDDAVETGKAGGVEPVQTFDTFADHTSEVLADVEVGAVNDERGHQPSSRCDERATTPDDRTVEDSTPPLGLSEEAVLRGVRAGMTVKDRSVRDWTNVGILDSEALGRRDSNDAGHVDLAVESDLDQGGCRNPQCVSNASLDAVQPHPSPSSEPGGQEVHGGHQLGVGEAHSLLASASRHDDRCHESSSRCCEGVPAPSDRTVEDAADTHGGNDAGGVSLLGAPRPHSRRDQITALLGDVAIALLKAAPQIIEVELERRGYTRPTTEGEA